MENLVANLTGGIRKTKQGGREYIIAPMTLIVPGVLNGSRGALYYPPEEVGKNPSIWDDVPIVVYHPTRNGQAISAHEDGILDKVGVGILRKCHVDNKGRLRAEGWFDVAKCQAVDNRVLDALYHGRKMELSTGLFTENEPAPFGSHHNGRPYSHIARNYHPDHLAILPDQVGACSLNDGCGLMVNRSDRFAPVANAFCPTGEGGGQDNSCSSRGEEKAKFARTESGEAHQYSRDTGDKQLADRAARAASKAKRASLTRVQREALAEEHESISSAHSKKAKETTGQVSRYHQAAARQHKTAAEHHFGVLDVRNAFCPTGEGGGQDNSCPPGQTGSPKSSSRIARLFKGAGKALSSFNLPGRIAGGIDKAAEEVIQFRQQHDPFNLTPQQRRAAVVPKGRGIMQRLGWNSISDSVYNANQFSLVANCGDDGECAPCAAKRRQREEEEEQSNESVENWEPLSV